MQHELHELTRASVTAFINDEGASEEEMIVITAMRTANKYYEDDFDNLICVCDDYVLIVKPFGDFIKFPIK